jgi:hypothetical protein
MNLVVRCLALLTRPVDAYVSWHSVVCRVVRVLLRIDTILLRDVSLVRGATHVVAD